MEVHPVHGRRAGDHAVEVGRIANRRGDALTSSLRAAVPDRELLCAAVEAVDQRLGLHGHLVYRAITEVDDLLRMADRERRVIANVASIGSRRRVSVGQRASHRPVRDGPGPGAVADSLESSIPLRRQPDLDPDVRVGGWTKRCGDTAELGQRRIQRVRRRSCGRLERSGRHHHRGGDGCRRQRQGRRVLRRLLPARRGARVRRR